MRESVKPFVLGLACGVVLAIVAGFGAGWVVTAGAKEQAVQAAKVSRLGSICAVHAAERWQAQGKELSGLHGWANREQREQLARQVADDFRLEGELHREVVWECARQMDA
jgi:hypothetical protein